MGRLDSERQRHPRALARGMVGKLINVRYRAFKRRLLLAPRDERRAKEPDRKNDDKAKQGMWHLFERASKSFMQALYASVFEASF